jgi:hypothetical protein
MKVVAIKDFTLAGETHAKGEVFECDEMRGKAWIVAKVVREATPEDEAAMPIEDDPKVKRLIDEEDDD